MANEVETISAEELQKALDTLGISLTTEDTLQKAEEDSKEDKEEDKKIGGEKKESAKEQKVEGKKDEESGEDDEEIEKAYKKTADELAELEKACGMKKAEVEEMGKKRKKLPDEPMEKAQVDELVKAEFTNLGGKVDAVTVLFKKTIEENNELRKALNSTLSEVKSQNELMETLKKTVLEIGNQSMGRKSIITSKAIEKSFGGDLGNDAGKKVLSLSKDRVELEATLLDFSGIEKGVDSDINMSYANAATLYNTSRTLDRATINDLASKNIKIVE